MLTYSLIVMFTRVGFIVHGHWGTFAPTVNTIVQCRYIGEQMCGVSNFIANHSVSSWFLLIEIWLVEQIPSHPPAFCRLSPMFVFFCGNLYIYVKLKQFALAHRAEPPHYHAAHKH